MRFFTSVFTVCLLFSGLTGFTQAPTSLQYPVTNVFQTNIDNVFLAPTVSGNIDSYSIAPALPAGLAFNTNTGVISGMATGTSAATAYTVSATNDLGSTSTALSIAVINSYYNNNNGQVSFLAANAVPKVYASLATAGQTPGDIVLYTSVVTIGGQAIDCIIKTRIVSNVTLWDAYDRAAASGTNFNSNSDNFFSPQVTYGAGGGSMTFDFQFILGGSYVNATNTGTNVILQNVKANTYDIDGNGTARQYNEFDGFSTSELGTTTNQVVSYNAATGQTRYTSNSSTNTATVTDPRNRVRVSYNEMSSFSIGVGANNSGLAYFFLDFSVGGAFTTSVVTAPSLDLNTSLPGVNNRGASCGNVFNFSGGSTQTNAASVTDLSQYTIRFSTAEITNGANEQLLIGGATSGGTIALNFANAAAIPNVVFGTTITYSVTATVSAGVSTLRFARVSGSSNFTLARAEEFTDALRYQNIAAATTNGSRSFTLNISNTLYRSPDAILTTTINCVGLAGNIFHDANGLTDNLVNANSSMGQFANGSMFGVLVNSSTGLVLKTQGITSSNFNFGNITPGSYRIYFSNGSAPAIGSSYSASTFPSGGYISTGENLGADMGNDLLADGLLTITVGAVPVTQANFGIQIPPVATGVAVAGSLNPGGYNNKLIPAASFGATDADGTVSLITITSFPSNVNYLKVGSVFYTNGGPCPPQTTCTAWPGSLDIPFVAGAPASSIAVDPVEGATTVSVNYTATDNGNAVSNGSWVQVPFTIPGAAYTISGNVWNDANGDGINAAEALLEVANPGQSLYAVLVQTTNTYSGVNTIYATAPITAAAGYMFGDVPAGNNYLVRIISLASAPVDGAAESVVDAAMAANYIGVSTNNGGIITTGLNTNDPVNILTAFNASVSNVNFGIEQLPFSVDQNYTIPTPASHSFLSLNGTGAPDSPAALAGSDAEDQPVAGSLANKKVYITQLPTHGNELYYNGTLISLGTDGINPPSAGNPFVISSYNPALLRLKFTGIGSLTTTFTYNYVDAAGNASATAAGYTITWATVLPVNLLLFSATKAGNGHKINWTVSEEVNVEKYEVEYSNNGVSFSSVGVVDAKNISGEQQYSFNYMPAEKADKYYYRLKIINAGSVIRYSDIRTVSGNAAIQFSLFPNPTSNFVYCEGLVEGSMVSVKDVSGRTVASYNAGNAVLKISLNEHPNGIYLITATNKNGEALGSRTVIKQ